MMTRSLRVQDLERELAEMREMRDTAREETGAYRSVLELVLDPTQELLPFKREVERVLQKYVHIAHLE